MSAPASDRAPAVPPADSRLRLPLLVIATAQLMLVLDDSIANIALPTLQNELDIAPAVLPWVINAYILMFGALLLFGGRVGDVVGRRRTLQLGMVLFVAGSLVAGVAPNGGVLIAGRVLQGIGAALTAPNALALIATTFPAGKARSGALATYGAMSALGIVLGLLLGGVLTGTLGWRWVFFINVPIGLAVLAGTRVLVDAERHQGRIGIGSAVTGSAGMAALVYAITHGGESGWGDVVTVASFAAAAVLLTAFVVVQARSADPMLPLPLLRDRSRSGAYLGTLLLAIGPMGAFYLLTLHMQHVLQYSPLQTGLAWLPFAAGIVIASGLTAKLMARLAARVPTVVGLLIAGGALLWLSTMGVETSYLGHLMPAMFALAFGFGMSLLAMTATAVDGVRAEESGVASATLNSAQQLGVALGLAVLSTVAITTTNATQPDALTSLHEGRVAGEADLVAAASEALVQGYATALLVGGLLLVAAAALTALLISTGPARDRELQPATDRG
ncbi:MFS transporter [Actinotalea ferrariae]|uniref:MFS transporter n=1 Tax=Actinotalea ferrariae TaxID=1386098 RepID=UPI001C8CAB62|nr:MFS transporter [Actinotalea ferrariae]MBX9244343.1 MFS transporter [Actinotalea ferrariae]